MKLLWALIGVIAVSLLLYAKEEGMQQIDPHSFSKPNEAVVQHLHLDIRVDFQEKKILGKASLQIQNKAGVDKLYLDTNGLSISKVTLDQGVESSFTLEPAIAPMGQALVVSIRPETKLVHVEYSTDPEAAALQWLEPAQTQDKKYPFLYTQSQAILARSWIPCQDTPSVRMTYTARVQVPPNLLAVMSAENPRKKNESGVYEFRMRQPIPSYLLALAVGDIAFRATGERTGVYAEPSVIEKAAWEFAETPQMMATVEELYGPYRWERYDLIVLPPSFPWGGMENPRLTFVTPTLLAGDRSLVATIAHELAHSWSGNLVTNATWNDFWLNEGFTNYLTHRIMETVYGDEYAKMLTVLQFQDLHREVAEIGPTSADTHLKMNLAGRDPEVGVTAIPYEKGEFLLFTIEAAVGRERWDAFLNQYFKESAFQSMTTEQFLSYLRKNLVKPGSDLEKRIQIDAWIYGPGIPPNILKPESESLKEVDHELGKYLEGKAATELDTNQWTTHHWIHFIRNLPQSISAPKMEELDRSFQLTGSNNAEILNEWLRQVITKRYAPAYPAIEKFLISQGRRKYVKLLFTELIRTKEGREMAERIYGKARPFYHSATREVAERILRSKQN
ncbi:M1 family metallopeptidase [bacterium]|nr:M1 family metallopeptidase [bacterium]